MKKTISRLSMFAMAVGICFYLVSYKASYKSVLQSQEGINFKVTTLADAKQNAKTQNKPLFVFAHASWCPTCKKMEQEVLNHKELGNTYNKDFVDVAIDIDSPDGKELQKIYPIRATPTLFFFNSAGNLTRKIEGYTTADELLSEAKIIK